VYVPKNAHGVTTQKINTDTLFYYLSCLEMNEINNEPLTNREISMLLQLVRFREKLA
jgi:hypothetical protein